MTYGLMPEKDFQTMDEVLKMVCNQFPNIVLNTLEIGVHHGITSRGIRDYLAEQGRTNFHTAIDNQRDFKMGSPFPECKFIVGNSIEVYNQVEDYSQHFLFIDGNHSYPMTMADFLVYSDKIVPGGYIAFHDCGKQIKPLTDFQGIGDMDDPDMYIACRKAVDKLGLLSNTVKGWVLVLDEWDENFHTGGIVVVQRVYFEGEAAFYLGEEQPIPIVMDARDVIGARLTPHLYKK